MQKYVIARHIPADHQATEPDMFGTTRRPGEETAEMAAAPAEGQPGAATIADVPAARADVPAARTPAGEAPVGVAPAGDTGAPAGDVPATAAEATSIPAHSPRRPVSRIRWPPLAHAMRR